METQGLQAKCLERPTVLLEELGRGGGCGRAERLCLSKGAEGGLQPIVAIQTTAPLLPDLKIFSEARELDFGVNLKS